MHCKCQLDQTEPLFPASPEVESHERKFCPSHHFLLLCIMLWNWSWGKSTESPFAPHTFKAFVKCSDAELMLQWLELVSGDGVWCVCGPRAVVHKVKGTGGGALLAPHVTTKCSVSVLVVAAGLRGKDTQLYTCPSYRDYSTRATSDM